MYVFSWFIFVWIFTSSMNHYEVLITIFLPMVTLRQPVKNKNQLRTLHSTSERSVLALEIVPFRWVKYSPIYESNLAPLNQGQYSPISKGWFGPRAEMGPTVGWNSLLIELFWPKLCSNGSRKGWIRLWPAGPNWPFGTETDLLNFQCTPKYKNLFSPTSKILGSYMRVFTVRFGI